MSDIALKHIEHLANAIGPRGSATPKEREGHEYVQQTLAALGGAARLESFPSVASIYVPLGLGLGLILVAEALYWLIGSTPNGVVGALAAALLNITATLALVLELLGKDNPLRWFTPMEISQNAIGVTPSANETKRKVAVLAHVDTHRTPLIWRSRRTFALYRALSVLELIGVLALCAIFIVSIFAPNETLRTASLIPAAIVALMLAILIQAHFTPYTPGANDNASGVGVLLALAARLKETPLSNTEVWWVATGCEEVNSYGSADFIRRHAGEFKGGAVIVVDNVAGKETGPVYLRSEGILIPLNYPAETLALADQIAAAHPELGARSRHMRGAATDGTPALNAGLDALSFVGYTRDGWIPNWHNLSDNFANVDPEAVDRAERFVWALLQKLDE
jgi:hypothetical protein